jgi:LytS/YehU family sensor histidine kinase
MDRVSRLEWLVKFATTVENACKHGINPEELKSALRVGINAYECAEGMGDEVNPTDG